MLMNVSQHVEDVDGHFSLQSTRLCKGKYPRTHLFFYGRLQFCHIRLCLKKTPFKPWIYPEYISGLKHDLPKHTIASGTRSHFSQIIFNVSIVAGKRRTRTPIPSFVYSFISAHII
jgi:hypothetical protein